MFMCEHPQFIDVSIFIHRETQSMTGTGYSNQPLGSGTNLIVGLTHSARNVIVILAMEKDHGNPAAFQCLPGRSIPKIKPA